MSEASSTALLPRRRWGELAWIPVVAAACGYLVVLRPEDAAAAAAAAVLGAIGLAIVRFADREHERAAASLFLLAFSIRVVSVFLLHYTVFQSDPTLLAGDDLSNDRLGLALAQDWQRSGISLPAWPGYREFVSFVYLLTGNNLLMPRVMNAAAGSLAVAFAALAAGRLFGRQAIRPVGVVGALFPSLIVWSSLNLKEAWALLAIGLVVYSISSIRSGRWRVSAPSMLGGLVVLSFARAWMLFVVACGLAIGSIAVITKMRMRAVAIVIAVAASMAGLIMLGAADIELESAQTKSIADIRASTTTGESALEEGMDLSSPLSALISAPPALARVVLGPYPWTLSGARQVLALPEMIGWYLLLPAIVFGIRRGRRIRKPETIQMVILAATILIAIAMLEGNLGLIYRHRLQAFIILLLFLGVRSREQSDERPATTTLLVAPAMDAERQTEALRRGGSEGDT